MGDARWLRCERLPWIRFTRFLSISISDFKRVEFSFRVGYPLDMVGFAEPGGYCKAESLPAFLAEAVGDVGGALALGPSWLNVGPAGLIDFGLPEGLEHRVAVRRFGALDVHLPAREDLICFKLYAAVDQGPRSKHMDDLHALGPSSDELVAAARWTRTHDTSVGFLAELRSALAYFGVEVDDGDL